MTKGDSSNMKIKVHFQNDKIIKLNEIDDLKKYTYVHNSDWNKSTNQSSHMHTKNSNQEKIDLLKSTEGLTKDQREEFYEVS